MDFELGKARAGARATRVKGADRKYCVHLGKQLRQRALKIPEEGFHAHRALLRKSTEHLIADNLSQSRLKLGLRLIDGFQRAKDLGYRCVSR